MSRVWFLLAVAVSLNGQTWRQWGQNPRHTGSVTATAQQPQRILGQFQYDPLAEQIRLDEGGDLLVHYMAPLVDGDDVFVMSRGDSQWIPCSGGQMPCGAQLWGRMQWGVTRLRRDTRGLQPQWTTMSTWKPAPDNGSSWEPVFHPALSDRYLYMPGGAGSVIRLDRDSGAVVDTLQPFGDTNATRFVTSPLTLDVNGSLYYTVIQFDPANPWGNDAVDSWLVKIDGSGGVAKVRFADLVPGAPANGCITTFAASALPWPPSPSAQPPVARCGSQRPGLNAAPAIAPDGTLYVISRAHFNSGYGYLVAVNPGLTPKWAASLRGRLNDGCGVLLPPNGQPGGCRAGATQGVDPATNNPPAGSVSDLGTSSPVVTPDGSILYGAFTRYNYSRGHLMHFSPTGDFLNAYDFGWDITPAVYEHDGTWSAILKDNHYPGGSYCGNPAICGAQEGRFAITSLGPDLKPEWTYENLNDQACERAADGTVNCTTSNEHFEWCVNMVAVDRNGMIYANSEDGNVYAIDRSGKPTGNVFLKLALGAAYTPIAIGADGLVYAQNEGTLFVVGDLGEQTPRPAAPGHGPQNPKGPRKP